MKQSSYNICKGKVQKGAWITFKQPKMTIEEDVQKNPEVFNEARIIWIIF